MKTTLKVYHRKKAEGGVFTFIYNFVGIYRVVRGKRLEIHSTKVYNMLRAVMILHTIVRKSMIKFNKKGR